MSRIHFSTLPLTILVLTACTGAGQAASLVASPTAITLACDTVLGPTPVTVGITLATGATANTVTVTSTAGTAPTSALATLPSPQTVNSTSAATNFTFSASAGCKNVVAGTVTLTFTLTGGATPLTMTATFATPTTASGSALAPSPSAVTILCTKNGSTYTAGSAATVNVTSPAYLGTPFTLNTTSQTYNGVTETALPAWLTVTGSGTASATAVSLTITPVGGNTGTGCGALPVGATTYNVHLLNAPAPDKILPVTIQVGTTATMTASPASTSLSYTKGSFTYTPGTPNVLTSTPASFFTVDPATVPLWLNVNPLTGTAPTSGSSVSVTFVPTAGAETLALGSYTANVHLKVSGELDTVIPVNLQVKNPSATLTVAEGLTRSVNWTLGTALPTLLITPTSSDSPIAYAITTTAGSLSPQVSATQGIAYSFGSAPIPVTFLQAIFGAAAPGANLTGSVIFTPTNGSPAVTVNITVHVNSPAATLTGISPTALPTATSGTYTVILSGSGFVSSGGSTLVTKAGLVESGSIVSDFFVTPTVLNSTTISLSIVVPTSADPYLPFNTASSATVTFGVCNPGGGNCSTPTSTWSLTIGVNPIVTAVTSASSYRQATPPALTSVAAYDILSIFGSNFCVSGGTGCVSANPILYGATDPANPTDLRYLNALSPDAPGATQRNLNVTFQTHASSPVAIATGPLLFATNNQINVVVPSAVAAYIGSTVDIVVSFGYGSSTNMLKSAPYSVTISATDPGVFTVGGDGQGDAAALLPVTYDLVSQSSPATAKTGSDSDIIALYVTGLGVPDSTTGSTAWNVSSTVKCMAAADYWAAVNTTDAPTPALTSDDGLVVQSALFAANNIQPCIKSNSPDVPTVTVGGVSAPVVFAGWVADSVAGLYQINVQMPVRSSNFTDVNNASGPALTTPLHLPIVVSTTVNSVTMTSQPTGANVWVVGGLKVVPTGTQSGAGGSTGTPWGTSGVSATGTGTYTYAVTSGSLPVGLTLSSGGVISGTATSDSGTTWPVTITATEGGTGVTGSVNVTYTIN